MTTKPTTNSSISSISSSSCPSTFSSIYSTSTHLPVINPKTKNNSSSISALNENSYYSQQKTQTPSQTTSKQFNSSGYLYRNSWANLLTDIGENKTHNKLVNNKNTNKIKSEFSFRKAFNWIKFPWQNTQPTSSNINNNNIFPPPPPYEERIHKQIYNNNYLKNQNFGIYGGRNGEDIYNYSCGQNSTNPIIYSSRPAPFPLLAQPKTTTRSSSVQSSIPSSVGQQQNRLLSLRQPSGNEKIKRNRMQELREFWNNKSSCRIFCLAILLLIIIALIVAGLVSSHLSLPKHFEFIWITPEQSRFGTDQLITSIHGRLDVGKLGKQARLELTGTPPFRSNFVSILDFKTNRVAIMDMSLRSGNSQQQKQQNRYMLVCFVVDLDRQNIGDLDELLKSAKVGANRLNQLHGWEQNWQFTGIPLSQPPLFEPEIGECKDARWVHLSKINGDQKNQKCSECFDFCLPDWGIQKDVVRDENYLNILRQICFSLFIPEWRPFAQQAPLGGQQRGQTIDLLYNQQQPNNNKIDESKATLNNGPTETKWISLQTPQNNGLMVDQNRLLPSLPNSQYSSPLQFPPNQEQFSPITGQAPSVNLMSRNEGYNEEGRRQLTTWPFIGERNQKSSEMLLPNGRQQNSGIRQLWWT
ncbi:unnamed protein product [Meloidogyne enterolobii]|uniref:Uncharacterized protein n=1 Tax=Meloidogyne enterolobii TaxID=390850 RepID=A0ACB0XM82_MELEN